MSPSPLKHPKLASLYRQPLETQRPAAMQCTHRQRKTQRGSPLRREALAAATAARQRTHHGLDGVTRVRT